MAELIARKLDQYVRILQDEFDHDDLVFRGQRKDWPLLPRLSRITPRETTLLGTEQILLRDLRLQGMTLSDVDPADDFEWIALGQHHGLPTRLLDWTNNALAALWFAVHGRATDDEPAYVYVLQTGPDDFVTPEDRSPFALRETKLFRPRHITRRITAQSGWFTVHRSSRGRFTPLDREAGFTAWIKKIAIPVSAFADMRLELDLCGVNEASLFADLVALCNHLEWRHTIGPDEA